MTGLIRFFSMVEAYIDMLTENLLQAVTWA